MSEEKDFDPGSMDLPPSREFEEAAALLAYAAAERKPPARVKARLMASLKPESSHVFAAFRWIPVAATAAALIVSLFLIGRPRTEIIAVRGEATVDGRAASIGERLGRGQTVEVFGDGEAVVRIGGRAGFRLSHGARALIARDDEAIEVRLLKGWILSAVKTGTPYSVVTDHAEVSALGTDFIVKEAEGWAYVCICHGRLRLSGFPQASIASDHHYAVSQPSFPAGAVEGMKGHTDEEVSSLRSALRFDPSK